MTPEEFARAKRANDRIAILLVVITIVWAPVYLLGLVPILNHWLTQYINSYPIMLHLFPIFTPMFLFGWILSKKFPAPTRDANETPYDETNWEAPINSRTPYLVPGEAGDDWEGVLGPFQMKFKKRITYSVLSTIYVVGISIVLWSFWGDGGNDLAIVLGILTALIYSVFIAYERKAEFILYKGGFRLISIFGERVVTWSEIESCNTVHSIHVSAVTFIRAIIKTHCGKKIVLQNNWKPATQFYSFVQQCLMQPRD